MRLLSACIVGSACLALACGDDDPAPQTAGGGSGSVPLDASVRELPGDGLEPTPDFDLESRQRNPIGPERLNETLEQIRNGGQSSSEGRPDAGAPGDAADGGAS